MKNTFSVLRISGLIALAIILAELTIETGDKSVLEVYPIFWLVLGVILFLAVNTHQKSAVKKMKNISSEMMG